ncbi:4-carboxymuconolactone decarboxylase [Micromonospora profundi]|nr:hypothetical protein ADK66_08220 [Micromonospora sp. NRRL B-16802]NJC10752.1 4-carboxymuconolactone decarboxylase [Micromonospora profundi]
MTVIPSDGSSALFAPVPESTRDPETMEAYEKAHALFGHVSELFSVLANAPTALSGWVDLLRRLRRELAVEPRLTEPAIITVARLHGNGRIAASHERLAAAAGVDTRLLRAAVAGETDGLDADERLVCELATAIVGGGAPESLVRRCQSRFGVRETAELIIVTSFYCMVCRVTASMQVYVDLPPTQPSGD